MNTTTTRRLATLFALAILLGTQHAEAARIHVNAQGKSLAPDGSSWEKAFVSLQDALTKAASTPESDEIWVAQGTYVPTKVYAPNGVTGGASGLNTTNLRTFDLPDRVTIFGGFKGNENSLDKRNPDKNETILSGAGVSWHVVTAGNDVAQSGVTATLDGLTIREGNAQGPFGSNTLFAPFVFDHDYGGGLYIAFGSEIHVNDVQFLENAAALDGGGLFSINSNLTVTDSYFAHNSALQRAGAMEVLNTFEATPHTARISGSVFYKNTGPIFGGAIVGEGTLPHDDSSMDINESDFVKNTALEGGAIVFDSLKTTVRNSRFERNVAVVNAGALATTNVVDTFVNATLFGPAQVFTKFATTISNCEFNDNIAQGDQAVHDAIFGNAAAIGLDFALGGGALVAYMNGYLNVIDSSFRNNTAQNGDGGAILNGRAAAQNALFSGADVYDVKTTIRNSRFIGNDAPLGNGGAIASLPDAFFTIAARTVANTTLTVTRSEFHDNATGGNGGAIYLKKSTATLNDNDYGGNHANLGRAIYGVDSIINGSSASPVITNK